MRWAVRPTSLTTSQEPINRELPIDLGAIKIAEVIAAAKMLKPNRACGLDDVPAEFWKTIVTEGSPATR